MGFLVFLLVFGLFGCGGDAAPRTDLPYELYCNIGDGNCQARIYDSVAEMLEADGFERPRIRTISVEQHAEEVRSSVDLDELSGEDAESRGLRLMGFIPEASESVTATQIQFWIDQIAAYYSRNSHYITVVDRDYEEVDAQVLLAHELIHAMQNSQFDLNQVSAGANTEDGVLGVRGVIEGDAVHSSFAWAYEQLGYAPEEIDWDQIHDDREASLHEDAADPSVALLDVAASFPYAYGFDFMTQVAQADGLSGRARAFEAPPATAFEVIAGYGASLPSWSFPEVAHPLPLEDHTVEVENRFGALYVYGVLRRLGLSDEDAWEATFGWRGDELAVYQNADEVVAVWRLRFESSADASELEAELNAEQSELARIAVASEAEVFVFAAESAQALLAWAEQPLDSMTGAIVAKSARSMGGAISPGNCLRSHSFSLPNPPPLLQ